MHGAHGQGSAVPGEGARADVALLDVSAAWDAGGALRDAARRELPMDVRRAAVAGLGAACVAGASVIAAYLVVFGLATAHGGDAIAALQRVKALVAAGALCAGMAGVTRLPAKNPDVVLRLGLVNYVVVALLIGVTHHAAAVPPLQAARAWSPVGVWILLFGALVPLRP